MSELDYVLTETRAPKASADGSFEYVARIWKTPTGFFVKTHTRDLDVGFGAIAWAITGSLCDANGTAIRDAKDRPLVFERPHNFQISSEGEGSIEAAAAKIKQDFDAAQKLVVATVEKMARDLAVARAANL